ncbi:MAG: hypothetical protein AB1298_08080, partial [Bacteroidota bacterium]
MNTEKFSIDALEKKINELEKDVDKVEYISDEILRCQKAMQDVKEDVGNIPTTEIILTTKTHRCKNFLLELFNRDDSIKHNSVRGIKEILIRNICYRYKTFLDRAELYLQNYRTKIEIKVSWSDNPNLEKHISQQENSANRIIWRADKERLLALFEKLYKNEILPEYSKEEILLHFANEKLIPFTTSTKEVEKFCWKDSDCRFSVLVDELAKRGIIDDENKFKIFTSHFVNRRNRPFKGLAQKRSYTENYTESGNLIREIL